VSVEILRRRVDDEIRAELERALEHGREEGVVDDDARAGRMRERADGLDVRDPQQRIARRLDEHERRLARDRRVQGRRVVEVDELDAEVALARERIQQAPGAAVAVVRRDEQVVRPEQVTDEVDGRHARARDDPARAAVERGERLTQCVACRIRRARVVVTALPLEAVEAEGAREIDRRHDRAVRGIAADGCAHGAGGCLKTVSHGTCSRLRRAGSARAARLP
jgi:hypothetical protein